MTGPSGDEAGFSLIEALVGLAVAAMVLLGLGALAGQWLPHWRHGFVALESADLIGLALDRMGDDVGAAEYARLDGKQGAPLFHGEPHAVTFVRQAIGPDAGPRLEVVRIGETETRQGLEVERAHATFAPGAVGPFRDAATLLRAPLRVAFAYAGPDGRWRSAWVGDKLPRTIRLTVEREDGAALAQTTFALKMTAAAQIKPPPDPKAALNAAKR